MRTILGLIPAARWARLPLVVVTALGLLCSMLQCAQDDILPAGGMLIAQTITHRAAPHTADHALPCHGGHCLSHTTIRTTEPAVVNRVAMVGVPQFGQEKPVIGLSGLRLFKPPRA